MAQFRDRRHAGRFLAERLRQQVTFSPDDDVLVLGLPRGGVPVAYEVASALDAPLDVFLVRKLGVPGHEELAMGALASNGTVFVNRSVVDSLGIRQESIDRAVATETQELERREEAYRRGRPPPEVEGRTVVVVDDGLATGATMRVAVDALRAQHPARLIVAVPAAARSTCAALAPEVDALVCASTPEPFMAVGQAYDDFAQTSDTEVQALLAEARSASQRVD